MASHRSIHRSLLSLIFLISLLQISSLQAETEGYAGAETSFQEVLITGFTRARAMIDLATEVSGKAQAVYADVGDIIPADMKFACLDDKLITFDIETSESEIRRNTVEVSYFQKQVVRYQKLMNKSSTAQSQLDDFVRQLGVSRSLLKAEKSRQQKMIETRARHCITAPKGWQVVERYIEPGQWVSVGQIIAKVGDYTRLLVPVFLSHHELIALQKVKGILTVRLPDYDMLIPATIERQSPAFDEESRKFKVELQVVESLPAKHGGIRVELTLKVPDEFDAFLLPENTLEERFEEYWLERQDGQEIRVDLLGYKGKGDQRLARVVSKEIKIGDQFKLRAP